MGVFQDLGKLFQSEARQRTRIQIRDDNILDAKFKKGVQPVADENYIRLWVSELFLKNDSKWFSSRFPLAYSLVGLDYGGQRVEIANVSGKNKFDIKQADLGQSILRNYPLTALLPFRGGTIELDLGLVSMEATNVLQKFASVVSDLAGKLNAPQVASVIDIAGSVAGGVQELLGAGKAETVLYVHDTFDATLSSGFTLLSGKKQSEIDPAQLWISVDGIRSGKNKDSLRELDPQDFLVVRIDCLTTRDDWRSLPAISVPFKQALQAKLEGSTEKGDLLLKQARAAAATSPDLIRADRVRAVQGMNTEYNESDGSVTAKSVNSGALLARAAKRVPVAEARAFDWDEATALSDIANSSPLSGS